MAEEKGNNIRLYALSTCGHCKDTKRLLDRCGVDYDCVDVDLLEGEDRKAALDKVREINPDCCFPTLQIGDKVIVGFRKEEIREALQQL